MEQLLLWMIVEVKSMKNVMQRSDNKRNNTNSISGNNCNINYISNN